MSFNIDLGGEAAPLSESTSFSKLWLLVCKGSQQWRFCLFSYDTRTVVGTSDWFSLMVSLQAWQRSKVTKTVTPTTEWLLRKVVLKVMPGTVSKQYGEAISWYGTRLKLPFLLCQALLMWYCPCVTHTGAKRRTQNRPAYFLLYMINIIADLALLGSAVKIPLHSGKCFTVACADVQH